MQPHYHYEGWGHEALRGHVQCVYRITAVPISLSLVTQAGLLEDLHRLDTLVVEEVAEKIGHTASRHTITGLGRRASHAGEAFVAPQRAGKVAAPWSNTASSNGKSDLRQGR